MPPSVLEDVKPMSESAVAGLAGRLAEVFGPQCVDADRRARIAGHAAYAAQALARLPDRWQNALRCYAAGVNF